MNTTDKICEKVTAKLIEMIDTGVAPWHKPWTGGQNNGQFAISHTNGRPYSLLNQILLQFRPGEYVTFNQVKAEGGRINKGAKAQIIVFWCKGYSKHVATTDDEGNEEQHTVFMEYDRPILKYYNVFHTSDTTLQPRHTPATEPAPAYGHEPYKLADDVAEDYVTRTGVTLHITDSDSAFYRPGDDSVTVPMLSQFPNKAEYYSTLFHELTHSTGHKSRLNRFDNSANATAARRQEYSREELIAEIGAATALSRLCIDDDATTENSAAYLQGWAKYLKDDPRAFVVAAGRAEKAINLIFND